MYKPDHKFLLAGPLLTLGTILAVELFYRLVLPIPSPTPIYLIIVVFAVLKSGLRSALISAAIAFLYSVYYFSLPDLLFQYTAENRARLIILAVSLPAAALITSILQRQVKTKFEQALRRSQQHYIELVDSIDGIVWEVDVETFQFTFVSRQAERLLGYPIEQWLREPTFWKDHLHPDDRDWAVEFCLNATREKKAHEFEYRMIGADGRLVWLRDLVSVVVENDRAVKLRGVMIDVTERKRVEQEMAKLLAGERAARAEAEAAGQRLTFLAEASTLLASSLDYETTLANVARLAVAHLADWCVVDIIEDDESIRRVAVAQADPAKEEMLHRLARHYPFDPNRPHPLMKVLRTGQPEFLPEVSDSLLQSIARDSEHLKLLREAAIVSAMVLPLAARGRTLGAISFATSNPNRRFSHSDFMLAQDLARRCSVAVDNALLHREVLSERDRAEEASRAKDDFLAILSHELRNPLTPIVGWARILKNQPLIMADQLLAEGVRALERNAQNMARLVDDCLDLARISERKVKLENELIDLNQVVRSSVEAVRQLARGKGLKLQVRLSHSDLWLLGDKTRLDQVVTNLLNNAIKYTESGGSITVRTQRAAEEIELSVEDTGIGIAPEYLQQIFEPFRQGTSAWLTSKAGLGIGLAISRQIVEMHGGRIWAESEGLGRGSRFRVRLPITHARAERQKLKLEQAPGEAKVRHLRLLLIEDSEDILALTKIELERLGYSVLTAADGQSGLELAERELPDVIISDIKMPGLDGYELIRKIREIPELASTPAIALTGFGMKGDVERALAEGYTAHISKPVDANELSALIQRLIAKGQKA